MERYTLGLDFGTGSVRASLVAVADGTEVATCARDYAVYEGSLPDGTPLKPRMSLADPLAYEEAMIEAVRGVLLAARVPAASVVGIAADATSSTLLPTDAQGIPLRDKPRWAHEPHAYARLWKSHSAEAEARRIEAQGKKAGMPFMDACGQRPSSEWTYPKMLETLHDAPALYAEAAYFVDMCDWITWRLSGRLTRGYGAHAIKAFYGEKGLPPAAFWAQVDPLFGDANEKLAGPVRRWGERAGSLTAEMAARLGLPEGIAIGGAGLDAHVPMAALGMCQDGDLLLSVGTSNVFALISKTWSPAPGICSAAKDAMTPGFYGYDAGQAAVGDLFGWFVDNCVPHRYAVQAAEEGVSLHALLSRLGFAKEMDPSGVLALDWWNGNRSPLCRNDLSGAVSGLTMATRAEDLYRALVEATAYGARSIMDNFTRHGLGIGRLILCGGIARKNPVAMQCYADVFGCPLRVSTLVNAASVGAAVTAAAAYETPDGSSLPASMQRMASGAFVDYTPDKGRAAAYDTLYHRYRAFGDTMLQFAGEEHR